MRLGSRRLTGLRSVSTHTRTGLRTDIRHGGVERGSIPFIQQLDLLLYCTRYVGTDHAGIGGRQGWRGGAVARGVVDRKRSISKGLGTVRTGKE